MATTLNSDITTRNICQNNIDFYLKGTGHSFTLIYKSYGGKAIFFVIACHYDCNCKPL